MQSLLTTAAPARAGSSGPHAALSGLRLLLAAMTLAIAPLVGATPGEDGDITWTTGGTSPYAPNSYTRLTAIGVGGTTITVTDDADLALPTCPGAAGNCTNSSAPSITGATAGYASPANRALGPGDLLMIYQPQDRNAAATTINVTDTAAFGAVVDNTTTAHQAGLYEFVYVQSVNTGTNVITIVRSTTPVAQGGASACAGLVNTYDTGAANGAMVIRVPQLRNLTLGGTREFSPPAWDGNIGGVIALQVARRAGSPDTGGVLSFQGTAAIHADGDGFRGGSITVNNFANVGVTDNTFVSRLCARGRKGESIFGWSGTTASGVAATSNCDNGATGLHLTRGMGRGALANGGGGGNPHNGGGGGGANGGSFAAWSGGGVPNPGFLTAWQRERDALSITSAGGGPLVVDGTAARALVNSSGGGRRC